MHSKCKKYYTMYKYRKLITKNNSNLKYFLLLFEFNINQVILNKTNTIKWLNLKDIELRISNSDVLSYKINKIKLIKKLMFKNNILNKHLSNHVWIIVALK